MPGCREEYFYRNNAFGLYDLNGRTSAQEPLPRGSGGGFMKFTILVDPSLVIITIHLVCLNRAPV